MAFLLPLFPLFLTAQLPDGSGPDLKQWELDVRQRVNNDKSLKAIAAKYPLVVLHSRLLYPRATEFGISFASGKRDALGPCELTFAGAYRRRGGVVSVLDFNSTPGGDNTVTILGTGDFEKDPDPKRISIDDARVMTSDVAAVEDYVYLEHVRNEDGTNYLVVFRVVAVDPFGRYVAFLWRRLPGGKVVPPRKIEPVLPKPAGPSDLERWEREVRARMAKDPALKLLGEKYPLVLLHSRRLYGGDRYNQSAFSFVYESRDQKIHGSYVQLIFDNNHPGWIQTCCGVGNRYLTVDLGKVSFDEDPDPKRISISDPRLRTCELEPKIGHVYLDRVDHEDGNHFYVVFQIVAVDPESRYVAFVWRKLPGGKVVRRVFGR